MTRSPTRLARKAQHSLRVRVHLGAALLLAAVALLFATHGALAQDGALSQTDIPGPPGSGKFGERVYTLPNGNFVVVDSLYDEGATQDVGAVRLYDGETLALISTLTGSTAQDRVGSNGITVLTNGNFVVGSRYWSNNGAASAGAATWVHSTTGLTGTVSVTNSLVGTSANDLVSINGVTALTNGNYVVSSSGWDSGGVANAGAATWGNGATGISGSVSESNSLVGSTAGDQVGIGGVTALTNGNYVVSSFVWNNGAVVDVGAVTWGNGATGISGPVSAVNSLVGSTPGDEVGLGGATALTNGNYVVSSPDWDSSGVSDAGAVTWGDGAAGISGPVSAANSLVGTTVDDQVGIDGVTALTNGNFVVSSSGWDSGGVANAGAATWGNGATGTSGPVTTTNSLVGSVLNDFVGINGVTALTNGNYVVSSSSWDGAAADSGAATWGNGATGISGPVSAANSLVGSTPGDEVGLGGATALTNGNYVVSSPEWNNGAVSVAGAVTWGNGATGITGTVSIANSLVGSTASDQVGNVVTALTNGNYVVHSFVLDNGAVVDAGAATWGNGATGISGPVSAANSLVGATASDLVSINGVRALTDGNYVVSSPLWDGTLADVGAVTWGNGASGVSGPVSPANSLVGSTASDLAGIGSAFTLPNGNHIVVSGSYDGPAVDSGAISLSRARIGLTGPISTTNSVLGTSASGGLVLTSAFNPLQGYLVVGRPSDNIVTIAAYKWPLSVAKAGAGTGLVASTLGAIDCGLTCTAQVNDSMVITLTAVPDVGSSFAGWSGACTNGAGACVVTIDQARIVTATFDVSTYALTVQSAGAGSGSVSGAPLNPIAHGTVVTLTATAATGSTFAGWSGSCTNSSGPCELTMDAAKSVTATFALQSFEVSVPAPSDGGTVAVEVVTATGDPGATAGTGADRGAAAGVNAQYPFGTVLRFTALPAPGYLFREWGGSLSGSQNPQEVTVTEPLTIAASFVPDGFNLYLPAIQK